MCIEQIEGLFELQRDMTFGVRENAIAFLNPACKKRFGDLAPGVPADTILDREVLAQESGSFTCNTEIRGRHFTLVGTHIDDIQIYTLLPESNPTMEQELVLENVGSSMRETLTVLSMAAQRLTPAVETQGDNEQMLNLTMLHKSYYQLCRLCDNLSDFFLLRSGRGVLNPSSVDMVQLCGELVQSVAHFTRRRGIRFDFRSDLDHLVMSVDRQKINKLLLNLVSNSVKHMDGGGTMRLALSRREEKLVIKLGDTGRGIAPEELPYVFQQYQNERSSTDIHAGTGLGIPIVQEIARLHGGNVLVTSRAGEGTNVTVTLPIRQPQQDTGRLQQPMFLGVGDGMQTILTELADVLDYDAFNSRYLD